MREEQNYKNEQYLDIREAIIWTGRSTSYLAEWAANAFSKSRISLQDKLLPDRFHRKRTYVERKDQWFTKKEAGAFN